MEKTNTNYNMIVAMNEDAIIGVDNQLPWHISDDLRRFKEMTTNHIVVMGRKTFESLPIKPLPNRINIIITRDYEHYQSTNKLFFIDYKNSITFLEELKENTNKDIFIIGGEEIYRLFLPYCKTIYVTLVYKELDKQLQNRYFPLSINELREKFISIKIQDKIIGDNCNYQYFIFSKKG